MVYSSFSKLRILQLQWREKRAPSIAALLSGKSSKLRRQWKRTPSIVAMLKREALQSYIWWRWKRAPSIAAVLKREALQSYRGGGRERLL